MLRKYSKNNLVNRNNAVLGFKDLGLNTAGLANQFYIT